MNQSKATDTKQYDSPDLDWSNMGSENDPSRVYFRTQLDSAISFEYLHGKRVLDIGSGIGQLFNWLKEKGASRVVGIDPSDRNILTSRERYPWVEVHKDTLHEFALKNKEPFDAAVSVMVFEHIENLDEAFADVGGVLVPGGEFFLIIGDKDYHLTSDPSIRGEGALRVEVLRALEGDAVETKTIYSDPSGIISVIYDIFRPLEEVLRAARENGLEPFVQNKLMGPFAAEPADRRHCVCYLIGFRKK